MTKISENNYKNLATIFLFLYSFIEKVRMHFKNVNRKVQGVPQSQTAANPRHQQEEKMTKTNMYKINKKCTRSTQTSSLFLK